MDFEQLKWLIGIIPTAIAVISGVIAYVRKNIKYIKEKDWNKLSEELKKLISVAEGSTHYTGAEKKDYVLTKANQYAIENGIKFDIEKAGLAVDEFVALTKQVNKRDKDIIIKVEPKVEIKDANTNIIKNVVTPPTEVIISEVPNAPTV